MLITARNLRRLRLGLRSTCRLLTTYIHATNAYIPLLFAFVFTTIISALLQQDADSRQLESHISHTPYSVLRRSSKSHHRQIRHSKKKKTLRTPTVGPRRGTCSPGDGQRPARRNRSDATLPAATTNLFLLLVFDFCASRKEAKGPLKVKPRGEGRATSTTNCRKPYHFPFPLHPVLSMLVIMLFPFWISYSSLSLSLSLSL